MIADLIKDKLGEPSNVNNEFSSLIKQLNEDLVDV